MQFVHKLNYDRRYHGSYDRSYDLRYERSYGSCKDRKMQGESGENRGRRYGDHSCSAVRRSMLCPAKSSKGEEDFEEFGILKELGAP
jgi:hypothetical protein